MKVLVTGSAGHLGRLSFGACESLVMNVHTPVKVFIYLEILILESRPYLVVVMLL